MLKNLINSTKSYIVRFCELQLFISLISLPILINWGLPLSLLAPLGNLIFTPFIMLFLMLSSLIFFLEILCIPNRFWIASLEVVYKTWMRSMSYIPFSPLIGFAKPHPLFLVVIPIAAVYGLISPALKGKYRRLIYFVGIFIVLYVYMSFIQCPRTSNSMVNCAKGEIQIIYENNQIAVIDPGHIGQYKSALSWLGYTLMPHITQTTGKTSINYFICLSPTQTTIKALAHFISEYVIETLYTPFIENRDSWYIAQLERVCKEHNCLWIEVANNSLEIDFGLKNLTLKPENKKRKRGGLVYKALSLS